jgi:hypothetical protein
VTCDVNLVLAFPFDPELGDPPGGKVPSDGQYKFIVGHLLAGERLFQELPRRRHSFAPVGVSLFLGEQLAVDSGENFHLMAFWFAAARMVAIRR